MPIAHDIPGAAFKNGSAILLARVVGEQGQPIAPSQIASGAYTVFELDPAEPNSETPVAAHTNRPLTVNQVLFAVLQRDPTWTVDAQGYNFRHVLDVGLGQPFAAAGRFYRVRYELIPVAGQPILVRFKVKAI